MEETDIRESISRNEQDLAHINDKIDYHHLELTRLYERRSELDDIIQEQKRQTSVRHRIPSELWVTIFTLACYGQGFVGQQTYDRLDLAEVCKEWRSIVINAPVIWRCINVTFSVGRWSSLEHIKSCISRSGTMPLVVTITSSHQTHTNPAAERVLQLVLDECHRWLYFALSLNLLELEQFQQLSGRTPELRGLDLRPPYIQTQHLNIFGSVPRLQALLCHSMQSNFNSLPLKDLEIFSCARTFTTDALNFLKVTPKLRICNLLFVFELPSVQTSGLMQVEASSLKHLSVTLTSTVVEKFFANLTAPSLEHISIQQIQSNASWPHDTFVTFLRRSKAHIRILSLQDVTLSDEKLISYLEMMPELQEMDVKERQLNLCVTDNLLKRLTYSEKTDGEKTTRVLAPRLEVIKLSGNLRVLPSTLVRLVESRRGHPDNDTHASFLPVARLATLRLCYPYFRPEPHIIEVFDRFRKEGLVQVAEGSQDKNAPAKQYGLF